MHICPASPHRSCPANNGCLVNSVLLLQSVINFLLSTEIIPLCLRTMEMGTDLSRTVATFIVQKILTDELGLTYICATPERFFAVGAVLTNMVESLTNSPSPRLLKHILRCAYRPFCSHSLDRPMRLRIEVHQSLLASIRIERALQPILLHDCSLLLCYQ